MRRAIKADPTVENLEEFKRRIDYGAQDAYGERDASHARLHQLINEASNCPDLVQRDQFREELKVELDYHIRFLQAAIEQLTAVEKALPNFLDYLPAITEPTLESDTLRYC